MSGLIPRGITIFLFGANLLYFLLHPSRPARAVAAFGMVVSALLLLITLVRGGPRAVATRGGWVAAGAAFALPLIATVWMPTIVFWRLDGRAWLAIAWVAVAAAPMIRALPDAPTANARWHGPARLTLFIVWASVVWLTLVWDVGVGRVATSLIREERVLTSARIWDAEPASKHLYLVWLTPEDYARGNAYTNHPHPFALLLYAAVKMPQRLLDVPTRLGRNLVPIVLVFPSALALAALAAWAQPAPSTPKTYIAAFFGAGLVMTEWHLWADLYGLTFDDVFPVVGALTAVVAAVATINTRRHTAALVVATAVFALFGWIYTSVLLVALWCCFGRIRRSPLRTIRDNQALVIATLVGAAIALIVNVVPILLVQAKGYHLATSSFLFRSGLDGDERYVRDAVQSVLAPFRGGPRSIWRLVLPAFVPLAAGIALGWPWQRTERFRLLRTGVFLLAPYLFSVAIFPQSVSIHPELYDHLLFVPTVVFGAALLLNPKVQRRLRGPWLLLALLAMATLLMTNFIAIAQAMRRLVPPSV